jgi:hypothetical protein
MWCSTNDNFKANYAGKKKSNPDAQARPQRMTVCVMKCSNHRMYAHEAGIAREPDIWLGSADNIAHDRPDCREFVHAGCLDDHEVRRM